MTKKVLIACEESQRVCIAFRERGFEAYSCDIIDPSGGHPEWHIKGDVTPLLDGYCSFVTLDGKFHQIDSRWDLLIAHPPCTYLCCSGNRWFNVKKYGEAAIERRKKREEAVKFFMTIFDANCNHIAIENPVGRMSTILRSPDCIIQPWQFGHPYTKSTCLWLKDLPVLQPTKILEKPKEGWVNQSFGDYGRYGGYTGAYRSAKDRSKTFKGIAEAMAKQWGDYINEM